LLRSVFALLLSAFVLCHLTSHPSVTGLTRNRNHSCGVPRKIAAIDIPKSDECQLTSVIYVVPAFALPFEQLPSVRMPPLFWLLSLRRPSGLPRFFCAQQNALVWIALYAMRLRVLHDAMHRALLSSACVKLCGHACDLLLNRALPVCARASTHLSLQGLSHRHVLPSTIRLQSPALRIERHVCLHERGAFPHARTHRLAWTAIFLHAHPGVLSRSSRVRASYLHSTVLFAASCRA
jgi:hypothetical protein